MKKYKWGILLLNLVLVLAYFNWGIADKEAMLKDGELVLIELAPVDPRSLMQGDYMRLEYGIANEVETHELPIKGYCIVSLDANNVASLIRFQENNTPLDKGETLLKYHRPRYGSLSIGSNSFFFQEGMGNKYQEARYGALKVDVAGNSLLIGLYEADLKVIE